MLDHGADINSRNSRNASRRFGETPLHRACENQTEFTTGMCKLLLDHGADVNARDANGDTPLHRACENQTEFTRGMCKLLLDHGADVKAGDTRYGDTPLLKACENPTEFTKEVCRLLLDHGADINTRNSRIETPIIYYIKRILRKFNWIHKHNTPVDVEQNLKAQVSSRNCKIIDMCEWLIKSGADVNIRICKRSETLYHIIVRCYLSCVWDNVDHWKSIPEKQLQVSSLANKTVTLLTNNKERRITVNSRDEEENTPLHSASKATQYAQNWDTHQQIEIYNTLTLPLLNCLISCGSKVNAVNDRQQTPLHLASTGPVIEALLRSGAEPNVKDEDGNTPLMMWASSGDLGDDAELATKSFSPVRMKECFEQGMDPFVANIKGDTVLDLLLSREKFLCANNLITAIVTKDSYNALRKKDGNGCTILHVLCTYNDDRIQQLIEPVFKCGADPNCLN